MKRHVHPGYELIYVIDGELINDNGHHGPGTLEVCPPNSSHRLGSEKGCTFLGSRLNHIQNATSVAIATADRKFLASLS